MGKFYVLFLRAALGCHYALTRVAIALRTKKVLHKPVNVMLTGTFYNEGWIRTHISPLANSPECAEVVFVSSDPLPDLPGVVAVYPPRWLVAVAGSVAARLLYFCVLCIRRRPDIIGGFHLLINGLVALLMASLTGRRTLYYCGGGQNEVVGGGYFTQNRIFGRLAEPDKQIESQLIRATRLFDLIITKGDGAKKFFRSHGVRSNIMVIHGCIDANIFYPNDQEKEFELIFVGRLSDVKRVDIFLECVARLSKEFGQLQAVIVGDGPVREKLEKLSVSLGITERVRFVGWSSLVADWLRKSKIFLLTSETEGLSQAMVQAMQCGLPVVVSNVGDLDDIVIEGRNGYLLENIEADAFVSAVRSLLVDDKLLRDMGNHAHEDVQHLSPSKVTDTWTRQIKRFQGTRNSGA